MEEKKLAKLLIAQGATMKEVIVCAINLTNAIYKANGQKIMRKRNVSFKSELQAFKQVVNNLKLGEFDNSKLIKIASEITKELIIPEIRTLNHKD